MQPAGRWPGPALKAKRLRAGPSTPSWLAEGHADSDLTGAASDVVRHGAVKADAGDDQRKKRKRRAELSKHDLLAHDLIEGRRLRPNIGNGHARVRLADDVPYRLHVCERVTCGTQHICHCTRRVGTLVVGNVYDRRDVIFQMAVVRV